MQKQLLSKKHQTEIKIGFEETKVEIKYKY